MTRLSPKDELLAGITLKKVSKKCYCVNYEGISIGVIDGVFGLYHGKLQNENLAIGSNGNRWHAANYLLERYLENKKQKNN